MPKIPIRPIRVCGDVAYVPLTQGRESIIDAEFADIVGQFNWQLVRNNRSLYANTNIYDLPTPKKIFLHRLILQPPVSKVIDHIDGDGLNNTIVNLRICTQAENMKNRRLARNNTSGYKGVSLVAATGKYKSTIYVDGDAIHLGFFNSAENAYNAYCKGSKIYHGDFGRTK